MGKFVNQEIRRLALRATCFRILARHTKDVERRARLEEWAEEEERAVAKVQSPYDPYDESYRQER